jgi:hypothetical protein
LRHLSLALAVDTNLIGGLIQIAAKSAKCFLKYLLDTHFLPFYWIFTEHYALLETGLFNFMHNS